MNVVFDLNDFYTKFFISVIVIFTFFILYCSIPNSEFNNNYDNKILDRLYYAISTHTNKYNNSLSPRSKRTKLLSCIHMIISYMILLI